MRIAAAGLILALLATSAYAQSSDVQALQGLQACIQAQKASLPFATGWGLQSSTATAGRKMLQTAANCAAAAAISSAIPCTPQDTPSLPSYTVPGTPTLPSYTTPSTPSGSSASNPCGSTSNPVPWTGLLCDTTGGSVTTVTISQLGPQLFKGTCDIGSLSDLAGLSKAQRVDFTDSGLSGTVPASWGTGAWSSTLQSLTLAQNSAITGALPNMSSLTALNSINIAQTGISGPIPLSAQGYPALLSFVASNSNLSGPLPASLPPQLTTLNVIYNTINGTLPTYNTTSLTTFQVGNNSISGCLPSAWPSTLPSLKAVDLSNNQLTGPIPSSWQTQGAFPDLQTINIVGNSLCGSLGSLGTPVGNVGQNNPSATRLVPNPGSLPTCGSNSCSS